MGRGRTGNPLKPKNAKGMYKDSWYRGADRARLRLEYNNDREAYFQAYRHSPETLVYLDDRLLTEGMKLFAHWESKLPRQARRAARAPYVRDGYGALEDLLSALAIGGRPSRNYLFVAIDFEGADDKWGIKELGFASFESIQIFDDNQEGLLIDTESYALGKRRRRKFMFGNTIKLTEEMMPKVICELFNSCHDNYSGGVVLVGHGVGSDLKIMEDHGVMLESLPAVVGMVDTGAIRELVERPLPIPPAHLRVRDYDDDWQQHIDGEDLCMDFILDLTDAGA
ncbi:hypothetical protein LTR09_003989 [Extremus antarcticus]|uniref:Gfd2/YDR514C-like C-terminal domain-containing protein n=1 Tax=Extremus antarcticus TaxID=702011 RepID=A0AAJ0DQA8_9PEZI|nr:hypothetical protein LTR09_003989 [Extremus antarcticus]